jgi:hypothetical protein
MSRLERDPELPSHLNKVCSALSDSLEGVMLIERCHQPKSADRLSFSLRPLRSPQPFAAAYDPDVPPYSRDFTMADIPGPYMQITEDEKKGPL